MKKILLYCITQLITASSCYAMDEKQIVEHVYTVAFLTHSKLAIGGSYGFGFFKNPNSKNYTITWQGDSPSTHNIITSNDKKKVAFLCKHSCHIYDTETEKKIDHFFITDADNDPNKISYSATFSSVDDTFFIYQNGKLTFDGKTVELPYTGGNNLFSITCHPTKKQLLHPSSSRTLSLKSFDGNQDIRYRLDELIPNNNIIRSVMYNLYSKDILLLTNEENEQTAYCYNPTAHTIRRMLINGNVNDITCMHPIVGILSDNSVKYYDLKGSTRLEESIFTSQGTNYNLLTHICDFSPDGTQYAAIVSNKFFIRPVPLQVLKNIYCEKYYLLKKYCIENDVSDDIVQLLLKTLLMFYSR
jgi:hypothetical protein